MRFYACKSSVRIMAADKIVAKLSSGDLTDIVQDVENLMTLGQQFSNAKIILRKVYSVVTNKSGPTILGADIIEKICKLCCYGIVHDNSDAVVKVDYKVSVFMYHILLYLKDRDYFSSFIETFNAFLPVLEPLAPSADSQQVNVLVQFGVMFYNECLRQFKGNYFRKKSVKDAESSLLELWQLMRRASFLSKQNLYLVPRVAGQVVTQYKMLAHGQSILKFQTMIISSLKEFFLDWSERKDLWNSEIDKAFIAHLCATLLFFENYTASDKWEEAILLVKEMVLNVKTWMVPDSHPFLIVCFLERLLGSILFSINSIPSSEYFLKEVSESCSLLDAVMKDHPKNSTFLQWSAFFINKILIALKQYWNAHKNIVKYVLSTSSVSMLFKLVTALSKVVKAGHCSACVNSAGQACALEEDVPSAFFMMDFILFLTRIHDKAEEKSDMIQTFLNCVKNCEELVQISAQKKCYQSEDMIFQLCESIFVVWAYVKETPGLNTLPMEKELLEKCKNLYFSVHKTTKQSLLARKCVGLNVLKALTKVLYKLGEEEKACIALATALSIASQVNQDPRQTMATFWLQLQDNSTNKELSLTSTLRNAKLMKEFWADYDVNTVDLPKWFLWEMRACSYSKSGEVKRLLKLWKVGQELQLLPVEKIVCCVRFYQALFLCDDTVLLKKYHEKLKIDDYHALLKKIPSCDEAEALCVLAVLCFTQFLCATRLHISSSKEATKEVPTFEPRKKAVLSAEDVVDQNDICSVPPTYSSLMVSNEESLLRHLDPAISFWQQSLEKGLRPSHTSYDEIAESPEQLVEAAMLCRLFGLRIKERRIWETCRTFARKMGNDKLFLQAVSGLMDLSCCEPEWVMHAQALANNLKNDASAEIPVHAFKNSCILNCLLTRKLEEGVAQLTELLNETSKTKWSWCTIQTNFLLAKYQLDSPHLFPKDGNKAFYTARTCLKWAKQWAEGTSKKRIEKLVVSDLMLSVSLWLGNLFMQVMLPREARSYLKGDLVLAQEWGLALRSAEFLSLLAQVDLLVEKTDECVCKIEGMKQILCLTGKPEESSVQVEVYKDDEFCQLRVPKPNEVCSGAASPELRLERVAMPDFVCHKNSCRCFQCTNLSLHKLLLDVGYLQASVQFSQFNVMAAGNLFKESIKLAKTLRHRQERLLHDCNLRAALQEELIRTEVKLKIKYADMLALYKKDVQAIGVNKTIFPLIEQIVPKDVNLFTDALEQRIVLMDLASSTDMEANADCLASPTTPASQNTANIGSSPFLSAPSLGVPGSAFTTPLRTTVKKGGSRAPLKAITPASTLPAADGFIKPFPGIPLFNLSDSDDSSEEDVITQKKNRGSRLTLKEKRGSANDPHPQDGDKVQKRNLGSRVALKVANGDSPKGAVSQKRNVGSRSSRTGRQVQTKISQVKGKAGSKRSPSNGSCAVNEMSDGGDDVQVISSSLPGHKVAEVSNKLAAHTSAKPNVSRVARPRKI